jgi:hypothetical protein
VGWFDHALLLQRHGVMAAGSNQGTW